MTASSQDGLCVKKHQSLARELPGETQATLANATEKQWTHRKRKRGALPSKAKPASLTSYQKSLPATEGSSWKKERRHCATPKLELRE